MMQPGGPREFP